MVANLVQTANKMAIDIDQLIEDTKCCVADTQWEVAHSNLLGLSQDCQQEAILLNYKFKLVVAYVPVGTVLTPAYVSSAILDLAGVVTVFPHVYAGDIIVNGTVIATYQGTYTTEALLIAAIVAAINANSGLSGYSAVNNLDGTITLNVSGGASFSIVSAVIRVFYYYVFATGSFDSPTYAGDSLAISDAGLNGIGFNTSFNVQAYAGDTITPNVWAAGAPHVTTSRGYDMAYRLSDNTFFVCGQNAIWTINPATGTVTTTYANANTTLGLNPANILNSALHSPFDDYLYFGCSLAGGTLGMAKINPAGVLSMVGTGGASVGVTYGLTVNTYDGTLYGVNFDGKIKAYSNPTGASPAVTVVTIPTYTTPRQDIQTITFYPSTTQANSRIIYGYGATGTSTSILTILDPNNLNTTPILATIDLGLTGSGLIIGGDCIVSVFYNEDFDVLFVGTLNGIIYLFIFDYVTNTVQLLQTLPVNDTLGNTIRKFQYNATTSDGGSVMYVTGNLATQRSYGIIKKSPDVTVNGTLGDTIPAVVQTDADNCLTADQISDMAQQIQEFCGNCCGGDIQDINSSNTNGQLTGVIYYGRSTLTTLTNTQVQALGTRTQANFAGTFNYVALASNYIYFCYPTSWGTPSQFKDLIGGFDVVMNAPFTVTILGQSYTCYRSFNLIGGAQSMQVIQ